VKDSLPLRLAEAPPEPSSPSPRTIKVNFLLKKRDLQRTSAVFEVGTGALSPRRDVKNAG
jgi:hypothetical protein